MAIDGEVRPLQPGCEIGLAGVADKGTLGLLLKNAAGHRFALSCSHVVALSGNAEPQSVIQQPVNPFVDPQSIAIGKLTTMFSRLSFNATPNTEDFAIVELNATIACAPAFLNTTTQPTQFFDGSVEDMAHVETTLHGAVSGTQPGHVIKAPETGIKIEYELFGIAKFEQVVSYRADCKPGDSGSAVTMGDTNIVLGIHVGGKVGKKIGYFLPVRDYLAQKGFTLL